MVRRPVRGDVHWVDFGASEGFAPQGVRPAVVVQNDIGNRFSNTSIVAGITTRYLGKDYPVVVVLPAQALPRPSAVNCAQVRTIDLARLGDRIARLDEDVMRRVDEALKASLGLL